MEHDFSTSTVLLVDDAKLNAEVLGAALCQDCRIRVADSGAAALDEVRKAPPDLILLDILMPEMDGFEVCSRLKADKLTSEIPIIFLSAVSTIAEKSKAFQLGAVDYITKPFNISEVRARVRTHLALRRAMQSLSNQNRVLDSQIRARTQEILATQHEIIYRLSRAAEYRDRETGDHIKRISHFCRIIAAELGHDDETCDLIFDASPMHDIGKIGIPDHILLKRGNLDPDEWKTMQSHTTIGSKILSGHDSLLLQVGQLIALTHHEKWDGSGYPQGLSQYQIPLAGRIAAVSDVFDALTSQRPYKKAWPVEKAVQTIREESGRAFDPVVVEAFLRCLPQLLAVKEQYSDILHEESPPPE